MRLGKRCGEGDASLMNPRNWPVYRQLTGTDRRGLGAAAKSGHPRVARTSTADQVVKSICPYCAVGVFEAGLVTARDPKYTIVPQRRRRDRRGMN